MVSVRARHEKVGVINAETHLGDSWGVEVPKWPSKILGPALSYNHIINPICCNQCITPKNP